MQKQENMKSVRRFFKRGLAAAPSNQQTAFSEAKMPPTSASDNFVISDSLFADFDWKSDDLLTGASDKNDYDWLLTPPGTPFTNPLEHNPALDGSDFLSEGLSILDQSPSSVKVLNTQVEPNLRKQDASVLAASSVYKRTPLTPSRLSTTTEAPLSSAQTLKPRMPVGKSKPSLAPVSHPTTRTSRHKAMTASQAGISSSSTTARKTGPSSPAATMPSKSQSHLHAQNHPLSASLSRSSSVNKARSQPSKSAPCSRRSSPWENRQRQVTSANLQSNTTSPSLKSNLATPASMLSKASSSIGTLNKSGVATATRKSLFSSSNQLEISLINIAKRASFTNLTKGKSASLSMDMQVAAGSVIPSNNIKPGESKGDHYIAEGTKAGDKTLETRHLLCPAVSPDISCSGLQVKPSQEVCSSPSFGLSKYSLQRSSDTAMHNLNPCQGTSNGHSSLVFSKHDLSQFLSSTNVEAQISHNGVFGDSDRFTNAASSLITSSVHNSSVQAEDFMYPSDFKALNADQIDTMSVVEGYYKDNLLKPLEYKKENSDGVDFFEQGLGKFGSCESPLVCPHGGGAVACDLCNVKMRLQMLNEKSKASFEASSQILSKA